VETRELHQSPSHLDSSLRLVVQLELANREDTPEAGYIELWRA
jgi:hypothetical protein